MLTKSKITHIQSLHEKSGRRESGCFIVEGKKGIEEFLASDFEIVEGFFVENPLKKYDFPCEIITEKELSKITTLGNNNYGLIVVKMASRHSDEGRISTEKNRETEQILTPLMCRPAQRDSHSEVWLPTVAHRTSEGQKSEKLTLVLDSINDPGNLGTIIRTADWYGISTIICSLDTVDCYNPKVIMATMGSLTRVAVEYRDLEEYLAAVSRTPMRRGEDLSVSMTNQGGSVSKDAEQNPPVLTDIPPSQEGRHIYGAYLEGESIHTKKFTPTGGYLIIGSESHGISSTLEKYITDKITIPRFGLAESLNAGVATAIILDTMMRELSQKKV